MNENNLKCPKCGGEMVRGFVPEVTYGAFGPTVVETWCEGQPQKKVKLRRSFWSGIPTEGIPLAAFRCSACGFVEFYAKQEFKAP